MSTSTTSITTTARTTTATTATNEVSGRYWINVRPYCDEFAGLIKIWCAFYSLPLCKVSTRIMFCLKQFNLCSETSLRLCQALILLDY